MCEVVEISDDEDSCVPQNDVQPKEESLNFDLPLGNTCLMPGEDDVASSSGTSLRSSFIGMGFSPSLVDKAIEEIGEGNAELLLETLSKYSDLQQPKIEGFDDLISEGNEDLAGNLHVKEEFDVRIGLTEEKVETLLKMNFSLHEVGFAMDRLGKYASIGQLTDFIFAARMAKKYEKDARDPLSENEESKKDHNNEALFCVMDKTLRLLEMGFSEIEISAAFERCGSEAPLPELTEFIVSGGTYCPITDKCYSFSLSNSSIQIERQTLERKTGNHVAHRPFDEFIIKTEEQNPNFASQEGTSGLPDKRKGKMPREECTDEPRDWKKPKEEEFIGDLCNADDPLWPESRIGTLTSTRNQVAASQGQVGLMGSLEEDMKPTLFKPRSISSVVAKPPYFFFGNTTNLSDETWIKISKFLYSVPPEFVNTKFYSALSRNEGYVHNLPVEDRFHVSPKGPMTVEEALPHTKKWWPSWDTRKQLCYINSDTIGISTACERLGRTLAECKGIPSAEQQREILRQCEGKNLVWVGKTKLAPLDPEHLEHIMGYPLHHSRVAGISSTERLESLKFSFQTDTLGYHLSVLRPLFPGGVTVLSFFSGIGGAELTLQRLGIRLKGVVSVEPSEVKRKIVKQWWGKSGQSGELIQIESIHKLTGSKLEDLFKRFGGFDIVVCQNPCAGDGHYLGSLDFSMFVEFVRVLQRVRSTMGRH